MKDWNIRKLAEAGIMIALSFILSKIKIYRAVNGGSVTAGSMIPIILFSLRWGTKSGMIVGAVFGVLRMVFGGYVIGITQGILEYPMAYGLLGLSGIFSKDLRESCSTCYYKIVFPIGLAIGARFICHTVAGVIFFGDSLSKAVNPWIASATYQATYLVPELIISALIMSLIWKPISRVARV